MITNETLFIVGAGAHVPYGMPTGKELSNQIIKELPDDVANLATNKFFRIWAKCFAGESFVNEGFLPLLKGKLCRSGHPSIDSFLDAHEDNVGIVKTGRLAVAFVLRRLEFQTELFDRGDHDWMSYLFYGMLEGTDRKKPKDFLEKNKAYFVTFNYDRTLEHFFRTRILASYDDLTPMYVETMLQGKIEIHHVYGDLGNFDPNNTVRGLLDWADFKKSSESIELMYSLRGSRKSVIERVTELFSLCRQIVFLGFGFDEQNINILGLNKGSSGKLVAATKKGLTRTEWSRAINRLYPTLITHFNNEANSVEWDCLALLRNVQLW